VLGFLAALPPCDVAMEACSSSHYWGREISHLGHQVRLISPNYVKPYLKRGKSDAHDARAICEAASRPHMRFVRVKSEAQQAALMQHTSRQLLIDQRTAVANSLRGQLAEFGVIEKKGIENVGELVRMLDEDDEDLAQVPASALMVMKILADQLRAVDAHLILTFVDCSSSERHPAYAGCTKGKIRSPCGPESFCSVGQPALSLSRSPTSWPASPGRS
jgi:transposase